MFFEGIGIDDTFVMLSAWRRTPVTMDVPERTAHMMSEAAVSIMITSLTDVVSLWIGKNSPFPAIQIFCIYTGTHGFYETLYKKSHRIRSGNDGAISNYEFLLD